MPRKPKPRKPISDLPEERWEAGGGLYRVGRAPAPPGQGQYRYVVWDAGTGVQVGQVGTLDAVDARVAELLAE